MNITIDGIRYSYEIEGDGPPLLLLHGFTGSKKSWQPFIPLWSKKYRTIAVDIIGHGETDSPNSLQSYTMEAFAGVLKQILFENGITKTNVLGYSMGGRLALYLAIKHPQFVQSILLESASPGLETEAEREDRIKRDELLADRIIKNGIESFVNEWENIPLFASQKTLPDHIKKTIRQERLSQNPVGLAGSLRGMGTGRQPSLWNSLLGCEKPVMLVAGSLDDKFVNIAQRMEQRLLNCQKMIVNHVGHAVHVESPNIFGKIVFDKFWRTIE
ncbi:MAG: 2-succinyl-6-hydroxy-2,4-cyclohexadiene-1-carboxylate synthase [Tuberibacillus sp.]